MISHIDHLVLTVRSLEESCAFYERALGFRRVDTPGRPTALHFGMNKLNIHEASRTFEPKAKNPTPGSADLCLITEWELDKVVERLHSLRIALELGPVERTGATGQMQSIYFRDPDGNLIEVSNYDS